MGGLQIMGNFFRGWRRKAGIVTLVIALLTLSGWLTSFYRQDVLELCPDRSILCATSGYGVVMFSRFTFPTREAALSQSQVRGSPPQPWNIGWSSTPIKSAFDPTKERPLTAPDWSWRCGAFACGTAKITINLKSVIHVDKAYVIIPYWSLVIPVTLLSAWLLLSKFRQSNPKNTPESTPSESK